MQPNHVLDAARDFRIASEILEARFGQSVFPLRATIVTAAFSVELYIKFLVAASNVAREKIHDLAELYRLLPADIQNHAAPEYKGTGTVAEVLGRYKNVFVDWRYIYEKQDSAFSFAFQNLRLLANAFEAVAGSIDPGTPFQER